jgi:hypothetical protein
MPGHPGSLEHRDGIADIVGYVLEVEYACIIVVLTREQGARKVGRVCVGQRVIVCVPATETDIEPADTCAVVVHDDHLKSRFAELISFVRRNMYA